MKTEPGNGRVEELTFIDDSLNNDVCREEFGAEFDAEFCEEFREELGSDAQESERSVDLSEEVFEEAREERAGNRERRANRRTPSAGALMGVASFQAELLDASQHSTSQLCTPSAWIQESAQESEAEEFEESEELSAVMPSSMELPELRAELRRLERTGRSLGEPFRSGLARLDAALPEGGLLPGSLVEWLIAGPGTGCAALSMTWIREACRRRDGLVVLIDRQGTWYPPALAAWGISLDRLLWVRPVDVADECWAIDQALRSPGVAVVWAEARRLDPRWGRRFRAAAEAGGTLGFFECSPDASSRAAWSDLQLKIKPRPRAAFSKGVTRQNWWFRIEVVRGRGRVRGLQLDVELDGITGELRELSQQGERECERVIRGAPTSNVAVSTRSREARAPQQFERAEEFRPPHSVTLASRLAHPTPRRRSAGA